MKRLFIYSALFFTTMVQAQQDPQFSQYIFNNLSFNPGSSGYEEAICATALHRSQWVGFEDAPVTTNLSVQSPLQLLHGGVGLNILTDKIGQNEFLSLNLSYAYRFDVAGGKLGIGVSVGVMQDGLDGSGIITENPDPSIPTSTEKGSSFDLGAGLFFNSDKIYVIDNGLVVGEGKHEELLINSKIYENFYRKQIKKNYLQKTTLLRFYFAPGILLIYFY